MDEEDESFGFTKNTDELFRRLSFTETLSQVLTTTSDGSTSKVDGGGGYGYLWKLNRGNSWNKRFFLVHGHYLSYFKTDPKNTTKTPSGTLNLWHVEGVSLDDCTITLNISFRAFQSRMDTRKNSIFPKRKVSLNTLNGPQILVLKATNPIEAQHWITKMTESSLWGKKTGNEVANEINKLMGGEVAIQNGKGDVLIKEVQFTIPTKDGARTFSFYNVSNMFNGSTATILRDIPYRGCSLDIVTAYSKEPESVTKTTASFNLRTNELEDTIEIPIDQLGVVHLRYVRIEGASTRRNVNQFRFIFLFMIFFLLLANFILSEFRFIFRIGLTIIMSYLVHVRMMSNRQEKLCDISINSIAIHQQSNHVDISTSSNGNNSVLIGTVNDDPNITPLERKMLKELQHRCKDLWNVPKNADEFIKKNEMFLKEWHADVNAIRNLDKIKMVMDKHILHDFRFVRFLRARKMDMKKTEQMIRESLIWRVALGSESIHTDLPPPPDWVVSYVGCSTFKRLMRVKEDADERLEKFWLRDKEGHLAVFLRTGHVSQKKVFRKFDSKPSCMVRNAIWTVELARADLERHREKTGKKVETLLSVIIDLQGFSISNQIPINEVVPIARRFFPIFSTQHAELLNRVLVFNAPWLFTSLWNVIKPFIPEEVQEKIHIHSGHFDYDKHVRPYFEDKYVPKYFGGTMVDSTDGNEFCYDRCPSNGPHVYPNEGAELLEGVDEVAKKW